MEHDIKIVVGILVLMLIVGGFLGFMGWAFYHLGGEGETTFGDGDE